MTMPLLTLSSLGKQQNTLDSFDDEDEIDDSKILWKQTWETFALKSAEGARLTTGKAVTFSAGFIAGTLFREFS